jgi:hypothetical protein
LELTHIGNYEQDSIITPYGTDGTSLYQLFAKPDPALIKRLSTKAIRGTGQTQLEIKNWKRLYMEIHDNFGGGVSWTGSFHTKGGGIPNGSEQVGFALQEGLPYDILPQRLESAGITGALDIESISPDFTLERLHIAGEERTLYGA